jgi:hypothetical protein
MGLKYADAKKCLGQQPPSARRHGCATTTHAATSPVLLVPSEQHSRDPRWFDIGLSILDSIFLLHPARKEMIEQIQICDAEFRGTNPRRQSTSRCLVAAGGIRKQGEIDMLDALGVDAVVGMALYSGRISA